jgi:hypothetical protein
MQTSLEITLTIYKKLLEELVDIQEIRENYRKHGHPAYPKWEFCKKFLAQGSFSDSTSLQEYFYYAEIMMDCLVIAKCSGGEDIFSLGTFANYGDANVLKKIRTRVNDSNQFKDLMTELHHAAWYISEPNNYTLTAFEKDGFPDFEVTLNGSRESYLVDCKRINSTSKENRYKLVIETANKQFKKFNRENNSNLPGLVLLDVSDKVEASYNRLNLTGEIPPEIKSIANSLKSFVREWNSSVSGVLLLWREISLFGDLNSYVEVSMFSINDRVTLIEHSKPLAELPKSLESLSPGTFGAHYFIEPKKPPSAIHNTFSQYVNMPFNPYGFY